MDIIVQSINSKWQVSFGNKIWPCTIGKNGTVPAKEKIEGDGKTPIGSWDLTKILYRADRISLEQRKEIGKAIEIAPLCQRDGWCDEPEDPYYNQAVIVPYTSRYEVLWKEQENTYDLIGLLSHNSDPIIPGRGSAIFLHVAKPDLTPTEGCVALELNDLLELLSLIEEQTKITIQG
ncbi:L,D-transpeptidase family protein [Kiloniella majae]|uniref:L,D-transpeptidase family protein n=1 Tax=Kiloniella majae TaxID=1938558 RepID=UPI000A278845|nr:L,D-transpeptidase family protein [Kiloniella majae]